MEQDLGAGPWNTESPFPVSSFRFQLPASRFASGPPTRSCLQTRPDTARRLRPFPSPRSSPNPLFSSAAGRINPLKPKSALPS